MKKNKVKQQDIIDNPYVSFPIKVILNLPNPWNAEDIVVNSLHLSTRGTLIYSQSDLNSLSTVNDFISYEDVEWKGNMIETIIDKEVKDDKPKKRNKKV